MPEWLNQEYSVDVVKEMAAFFQEAGTVNVMQILTEQAIKEFDNLEWEKNYKPLEYSYSVAKPPEFTQSDEFKKLIEGIIGPVDITLLECRKFESGDYTVLTDDLPEGTGFLFSLDLTQLDEEWGGYTSFVQDNEEVVRQVPIQNTLFLINQDRLKSTAFLAF